MEVHRCPHCNADLKGHYIEQSYIDSGKYPATCTKCGDKNHWRLETVWLHKDSGETIAYICPVCRKGWGYDGYQEIMSDGPISDYD